MNRKEQIAVLTAIENGEKPVQIRHAFSHTKRPWRDASYVEYDQPDFSRYEYRIKPEPRVIYVNEYDHGFNNSIASTNPEDASFLAGIRAIRTAVRFVESPE